MKSLRYLGLLIFLSFFAQSCEQEQSRELGGFFEFEIRTDKNVDRISIPFSDIRLVGRTGTNLDFRWELVEKENGLKRWTSEKLLYGTYTFEYEIHYNDDNGQTIVDGSFYHTFQIFPGETTNHVQAF